MRGRQTVVGFFDNAAEAQQAVQLLLAEGYTGETVALSTPTGLKAATNGWPAAPTEADHGSGRFFSSLFGSREVGQPGQVGSRLNRSGMPAAAGRGGRLVTVQTESTAQTKLVADLFDTAGAEEVTVGEDTE